MDPGTIAAISGVATATRATVDAVRVILEKAKGRDAEKAAREALGLVAELNTRLLQLQEIAFRLHQEKAQALEENAQLRAEIRAEKEGAAEREKYTPKKVGHSRLLVHEDDPDTLFCSTCFTTDKMPITVQPVFSQWGDANGIIHYHCNRCKTDFPT